MGKYFAGSFSALVMLALPIDAHSAGFKEVYSFSGGLDGCYPTAGVIIDAGGNLYGTTGGGACSEGTVFEIAPNGTEMTLYRFSGTDGDGPNGLVMDGSGNLYGTTFEGGASTNCGVVFEITTAGTEKTLHSFAGQLKDGCLPRSGLTPDGIGNYYGTTNIGGKYDGGTVFKITSSGNESLVYSFCRKTLCPDGESPFGGLVIDNAGNLYGTTQSGGQPGCHSECGTVFKLTPDGTETVLYNFRGPPNDGSNPDGTLIEDNSGNLYGSLFTGGHGDCYSDNGCGAAFKLSPSGTETIVHFFKNKGGENLIAGLWADSDGNLYGTTVYGGTRNCTDSTDGCGVAFELASNGTETVLHYFGNGSHGKNPWASLTSDGMGDFYGTTVMGGKYGYGTVFEITP
jgi:uncharacterized repeat protein (TIGR03803 family)